MAGNHPEFHIDRMTWKDLRMLYGLLSQFLQRINREELEEAAVKEKRLPQRADAHRDAALTSADMLERRVRQKTKLTEKEQEVWNQLLRDNNIEMLRARLRAFELYNTGRKSGIPVVKTMCLIEKNSSLYSLHEYVLDHQSEISQWLEGMNLDIPIINFLLTTALLEDTEKAMQITTLLEYDTYATP